MAKKVNCEGCLCVSENEYTNLCNLGYKLRLEKRTDGKGYDYISDDCELELVRFAGGEFRPTKRAPDSGDSGENLRHFSSLSIFPVGRLRRPPP